jgi:hypothetical protein
MHKNLLIKIGIITVALLMLSQPFMGVAEAQNWDFPRLDELLFVIKYPYTVSLEAAKACEIETYIGAIRLAEVETLKADPYNWQVTAAPGFHMCYIGINCRGVTPETSGGTRNYHNRQPGFALYPLELAPFRYALELIVGCEKDVWITDIYGYINVRLDTTVPPANVYWYNPEITPYPEDWDQAVAMLYAAGFTGTVGGNDWIMPNSVPLVDREADPVTHEKGIFVMSPISAPTSVEVTRRHLAKWNMFFCGVPGDGVYPAPSPLFHNEPIDVNVESDVAFINRDFDMYMLCWGLSKYPTSLYWFFATETDLPDVNQGPGLSYRPLDALLVSFYYCMWTDYLQGKWIGPGPVTVTGSTTKATKYKFVDGTEELWIGHFSMAPDFPFYVRKLEKDVDYEVVVDGSGNGVSIHFLNDIDIPEDYYIHIVYKLVTPVPINDILEMRRMCWDTQWMLYYACPYLPIYSRNYHDLYKPGLTCWVPSLGYGSGSYQLKWTYASVHWVGQEVGGTVRWHNPGQVFTFHPYLATWVYEVTILNRIYDGMIETDAFTHADIPWCALDWKLEDWTGPSGEAGMIVKYWIRNDLKWQDGDPITVDDFIWEYEFINSIKPPDYFATWSTYHGCIKYNDYCFGIKVNATGQWKFLDYTLGPIYPEKIWKYFWGDKVAAEAFEPWETAYTTYVPLAEQGPTPPPTCLYGTAEWIFDYHDWILGITRLYKNVDGWARAAATPCRQIAGIYAVTSFTKEKEMTITNITTVNKNAYCSKWEDEDDNWWHCEKHKDPDDNGLNTGDIMDLHCYDPPEKESQRIHGRVKSVTTVGDNLVVVVKYNPPKNTKTVIGLYTLNLDTKEPCIHDWELFVDGVIVASGSHTLTPLQFIKWTVELPGTLPPGIHVVKLVLTNANGVNVYTDRILVLVGDTNDDNVVDMADISYLVDLFLREAGMKGYDGNADVNCDDIVDMADISICIDHFLQEI